MEVLGQNKQKEYTGDMVLNNQELATANGFGHVSKIWYDKCITLDQGIEVMEKSQKIIRDIICPISHFESVVENGKYGWKYKPTGRVYYPTEHALNNMAVLNGASTWAVQSLAGNNENDDIKRDRRDAEVLKSYLDIHLFQPDRIDMNKERLFRTWDDGTIRACLSTQYIIINNVWMLELIKKVIPGGMLSHWKSNPDELWGNVLIPDTIRTETDSDYGGMLSIGNSEIGTQRISSRPSVFRAICMNGCIWNQQSGEAINKVHRGKNFNLDDFGYIVKENLIKQIPLVTSGIDIMINAKKMEAKDVNSLQLIGRAALDMKMTKTEVNEVIKAYSIEEGLLGNVVKSAFGLTAAITRAGQSFNNGRWVAFDEFGGHIVNMNTDTWKQFVDRSKKIDDKDLAKIGIAI